SSSSSRADARDLGHRGRLAPLRAAPGRCPTDHGPGQGVRVGALGDTPTEAVVLDLYAGSGALGIEALSRGADRAVFVERSRRAVPVIHHNLRTTRLEACARVQQ